MTIQSSGGISFSDLQNEFGGTSPISLSEYYAGGLLVPTGRTGINGAIPASGALSLANFRGSSKLVGPQWIFNKYADNSDLGSADAGNGLPGDYNNIYHGDPIWMSGMGVNATGWVGIHFISPVSTINILATCDNIFELYINGVNVLNGSNYLEYYSAEVPVVAGADFTLCAKLIDGGGQYGFICRVRDTSDNLIVKTDYTNWVSGG